MRTFFATGVRSLGIVIAFGFALALASSCKHAGEASPTLNAGPGNNEMSGRDGWRVVGTGALSPSLRRLFDLAARAGAGEPVDFDGDGSPEFVMHDTGNGIHSVEVDADGDGHKEYDYRWDDAAGDGWLKIDADSDGRLEYQATFTSRPDRRRALVDTDGDGQFDQRVTDTYDWSARQIHSVVERDALQNGTWAVTSDAAGPVSRNQRRWREDGFYKCSPPPPGPGGYKNDPKDFEHFPKSWDSVRKTNPSVLISDHGRTRNDPDGSCTKQDADLVEAAVKCALERLESCVAKTNQSIGDAVHAALARGGWIIACGNKVSKVGATTARVNGDCPSWKPWASCLAETNVNMDEFSGYSPKHQCGVMLHELMHAGGVPDDPRGGGAHDYCADDPVYACSRYCADCDEDAHVVPQGMMNETFDCARCADTAKKKGQCGAKVELKGFQIDIPLCHSGFASGNCEKPMGYAYLACDGDMISAPRDFICCNKCPPNSTAERDDLMCDKFHPDTRDSCNETAPHTQCPPVPN